MQFDDATGMTPMLLPKRRHDYLRRRSLLAMALFATAPLWLTGSVLAEDLPQNRLRKPNDANPTGSLREQAASSLPSQVIPIEASVSETMPIDRYHFSPSGPQLQLVSDGWNARNSIDSSLPLRDPAPANENRTAIKPLTGEQRASESKHPADANGEKKSLASGRPLQAYEQEPRSTLNFVIPETSPIAPMELVPAKKAVARSEAQREEKPLGTSVYDLYGPGLPVEPATRRENGSKNTLSVRRPESVDDEDDTELTPVTDPEQNEPSVESLELLSSSDEGLRNAEEPSAETLESAEDGGRNSEAVDRRDRDDSESVDLLPPKRVQVRDLTLGLDGSIGSKPATRTQRAEPISTRNEARQSVGDVPIEPIAPTRVVSESRDHIDPRGELILAIGMADPQIRVSANADKLRVPIERTLNYYWNKPEDADTRTHWGMFHSMMIYDKDTVITHRKKKYNAVAWMAGNNQCRNQLLFDQDNRGIIVNTGVGLQGHQAQMLAVFGLIDVPSSYPIYVGRNKYTVDDVLRREMLECKSGSELTFTLIGVSHYLDSDTRWVSNDGQDWDFERLIQEELSQPIVGAACGGTHRLMGFAHALRRRRAEGKPITGQWERADRYVNDFIEYTWQLQNRDGSMSTSWFEKSEDNGKVDRKIQTTGHMIEFLVTALPDDQLQSPQMLRSMNYLVSTLYQERGHEWQVGPKGHALRAIGMYYRRVFARPDPWRPISVAQQGNTRTR